MQDSNIIVLGTIVYVLATLFIGITPIYLLFLNNQKKATLQANFNAELAKVETEVQEQAFIDISQELHDSVGLQLCLARENLIAGLILFRDQERNKVEEAINLIDSSRSQVKNFSKGLLPSYLANNGLIEVLRNTITTISKLQNCTIDFTVTGEEQLIEGRKGLFLLRILQEAITNSRNHSRAQHISVSLDFGKELLTGIVKDDGMGFNVEEKLKSGYKSNGLGLQNIMRRAKMIKATCTIESNTNNHEGTIVCITTTYH